MTINILKRIPKYSRTSKLALSFALLIAFGSAVPIVLAQQAQNPDGSLNLVVGLLPTGLEAKPGTKISTELKVKNAGLTPEKIKISLMTFGASGEDGTPDLKDITPEEEFGKWVSFSRDKFEAAPDIWESVNMTIDIPADAAFGYYYAVVFSRDSEPLTEAERQANLVGSVASLVLLNVDAPGAKREAKLVEFSMPKKTFEFLPAEFNVRLENTGNTHVAPRGNIFISKSEEANDALLEVNQNKGYILPASFRKFDAKWEDGSPVYRIKTEDGEVVLDENDKPKSFLDWSNFSLDKVRFGKYTAHLVMVYDDGSKDIPLEAVATFWVIPWRIIAVGLVVLTLVLAGLYALVFRPIRRVIANKRKK
jgi:hypothetical protein